jgi:hypothetical protein
MVTKGISNGLLVVDNLPSIFKEYISSFALLPISEFIISHVLLT